MLQLGGYLLHRWDLVDPKCCLCLCQVEGPAGYFSHLQQTKQETQATSVCPAQKCQLGKEGHNLSRFSMGGFYIHSWLSGDAEPSLGALVSPPQLQSRGCSLGPSSVWWQQSQNTAPPFLSSFLNSRSLLGGDFSTGVLGRIFPC